MNASTPLWKAHDISQQLQDKIEVLPNVERAFVHVDHETSHIPVHILLLAPNSHCLTRIYRNIGKPHCPRPRDLAFVYHNIMTGSVYYHILILVIPRSYSAIRSIPSTPPPCRPYPVCVYLRSLGSRAAQRSRLRAVNPAAQFDARRETYHCRIFASRIKK